MPKYLYGCLDFYTKRGNRTGLTTESTGEAQRGNRKGLTTEGTGEAQRGNRKGLTTGGTGEAQRGNRKGLTTEGTGEAQREIKGSGRQKQKLTKTINELLCTNQVYRNGILTGGNYAAS